MHYYGVADRRITILEQLYTVKHETFSDIPYNFIDIFLFGKFLLVFVICKIFSVYWICSNFATFLLKQAIMKKQEFSCPPRWAY